MTTVHSGWENARNILCVRLDNMGDVLMTTPAMRALKEGRPDRRITLWTSPGAAAAARLIPEVDDTLVAQVPWMKWPAADPAVTAALLDSLRMPAFDAAVIFTVYSQSPLPAALMCHLAGIPRVLAHCRENPYHLLSDWVEERDTREAMRHEVQRQLDLVAVIGAHAAHPMLSLRTCEADARSLEQKLARIGVADTADGWILAHCGATAPSRRYPAQLFAEVIAGLPGSGQILLTGTNDEFDLVDAVARRVGTKAVNLAGQLTLGEMAVLTQRARLLLSNNSGPVHLAAALGTPVVVLYALTNPQHTPWNVPSRVVFRDVPCKYCYRSICPQGHHGCLAWVAPEEVLEAVHGLLEETTQEHAPMPSVCPRSTRGKMQRDGAGLSLHNE
jgi:lipopolysaccharide heptosyltransferase II